MNKTGPIIVIEDDIDDQDMLVTIFKNLGSTNKIKFFEDGEHALNFLNVTDEKPFLILSDINMPKVNGFELRRKIFDNERLERKCIPYLFFTTGANKKTVIDAYAMSVQGFFQKPSTIDELERTIKIIVEYWQVCIAPSEYE